MDDYLAIGCDVQVTELDISLENGKYSLQDQATKYKAIYQHAVDHNKANKAGQGKVTLVQVWGPNDANSWLKAGSNALLFDSNHQPKLAYNELIKLLPQSEWGDGNNPVYGGGGEPPKPLEPDKNGYYYHYDMESDLSEFINDAVHKLHSFGYIVEMDDFGSGYSSLNILKDIDFDIIKLDMKFLEKEHGESNRGGTILSSVVRMVNWLGLPVIAEGVETVKQADFLGSIGCDYIQGYLYSKPLPEEQYEKLISGSAVGATIPQMSLIETLNSADFWSNDSMDTLIFSSFVGGAAIFEYRNGKIEILRVNKKYLQEISMNMSEKDLIKSDPLRALDDAVLHPLVCVKHSAK